MDLKTKLQEMKNKGKLYGMLAASVLGIGGYGLGQHNANQKGEERLKEAVELVEAEKNAIKENMQAEKESIEESMQKQIDELNNSLTTYSTYVEENERLSKANEELKASLESAEAKVMEQNEELEQLEKINSKYTAKDLGVNGDFLDKIKNAPDDTMYIMIDANDNINQESFGEGIIFASNINEAIQKAQESGKSKLMLNLVPEEIDIYNQIVIPEGMAVSLSGLPAPIDGEKSENLLTKPEINLKNIELDESQKEEGAIVVEENATLSIDGIKFGLVFNNNEHTIYGETGSNILIKELTGDIRNITTYGNLYGEDIDSKWMDISIIGNGTMKLDNIRADRISTDRMLEDKDGDPCTIISSYEVGKMFFSGDIAELCGGNSDYGEDYSIYNTLELENNSVVKGSNIGRLFLIDVKNSSELKANELWVPAEYDHEYNFVPHICVDNNSTVDVDKLTIGKTLKWGNADATLAITILEQGTTSPIASSLIKNSSGDGPENDVYGLNIEDRQVSVLEGSIQGGLGNKYVEPSDSRIDITGKTIETTELINEPQPEKSMGQSGTNGLDRE